MKYLVFVFVVLVLILSACNPNSGSKNLGRDTNTNQDSCQIALKFKNAEMAESMVDKNYSGELNNYWGGD